MRLSTMMAEMESVTPPKQPFVRDLNKEYIEKKVSWNPHSLIKDALFYQFRAREQDDKIIYLPDACGQFLFELDKNKPRALIVGIHLEKSECKLIPGCLYFVFKPYAYLGMNKNKVDFANLINSFVEMPQVFHDAEDFLGKIVNANSFEERIDLMIQFAEKELYLQDYNPTLADYTSIALRLAKGHIGTSGLDSIIGYSQTYIRRQFKEQYGISPKQYGSIMRFQNILHTLVSPDRINLTKLASNEGYFDQAHFIRDFKRYVDIPPNRFRTLLKSDSNIQKF